MPPKPQMFNMLIEQSVRNIVKAFLFAGITGVLFQKLYCDKRKKRYREFYENYDIEKSFKKMQSKNLFQSC